jgi:hypothetical protein
MREAHLSWFKGNLDDEVKTLAVEAAAAYIERVQILSRLISIEPTLSANEIAVHWAGMAVVMAKGDQTEIGASNNSDIVNLHNTITREFFDNACQSLIDSLAKSSIKLRLGSKEIQELITPTLKNTLPKRRAEIMQVWGPFASNASRLSAITLAVLSRGLTKGEAISAKKYAVGIVESQAGLSKFERARAVEWLKVMNWSSSS